jgi:hypothetical protein
MSQQHTCYYSAKCKFSQSFLEELSHTPYSGEFKFVCVDGNPRPKLPAYVKAVPTLMIKGETDPRTDTNVMNWLSERRLGERQSVVPGGSDKNLAGGFGDVGPSAFIDSELFGSGDEGYAFIGEDTASSSGSTTRLKGNMAGLDDMSLMTVSDARAGVKSTLVNPPPKPPTTAKSKGLDNAYAAYQAERDRDFPNSGRSR